MLKIVLSTGYRSTLLGIDKYDIFDVNTHDDTTVSDIKVKRRAIKKK